MNISPPFWVSTDSAADRSTYSVRLSPRNLYAEKQQQDYNEKKIKTFMFSQSHPRK